MVEVCALVSWLGPNEASELELFGTLMNGYLHESLIARLDWLVVLVSPLDAERRLARGNADQIGLLLDSHLESFVFGRELCRLCFARELFAFVRSFFVSQGTKTFV